MALLRTGHHPSDWQDLGPARGRIAGSGGIFGGPIIAPRKPLDLSIRRSPPKAPYQSRPSIVPRCGKPLKNGPHAGTPCHRRQGHTTTDGCSSKATVERDNMRRRHRDFGRDAKVKTGFHAENPDDGGVEAPIAEVQR